MDDLQNDDDEFIRKKVKGLDQWKALITSFLMQSMILGTLESYGALLLPVSTTILKNDNNTNSKAALIGSMTTGLLMGFSPIASLLVEKMGTQLVALLGANIVFISTLFATFTENYILFLLCYGLLFGIGASFLFISSNIVISRYFEDNSTLAYGILGLGNGVMNAIMPHVMKFCAQAIQLKGIIRVISLMLSLNLFFPLYWNMDEENELEDKVILGGGYIPTKVNTKKVVKEQSEDSDSMSVNSFNKVIRSGVYEMLPKVDGMSMTNFELAQMKGHTFIKTTHSSSFNNDNMSNRSRINSMFKVKPPNKEKRIIEISEAKDGDSLSSDTIDFNYVVENKRSVSTEESMWKFNCPCNFNQEVISNKRFLTLLCAMPISMLGYQVPNVHIVSFTNEMHREKNGELLLTCLGVAAAIGPFLNALALQHFPFPVPKYRLLQVFIIGYGMVMLTLSVTSSYMQIVIVCIAIGYLDGSITNLIGPLTIDLVGATNAGHAMGMYYGIIAPSVVIAPPLAGFLKDYNSDYKVAFYTAGICFVVGGLLMSISCQCDSKDVINPHIIDVEEKSIKSSDSTEPSNKVDIVNLQPQSLFKTINSA